MSGRRRWMDWWDGRGGMDEALGIEERVGGECWRAGEGWVRLACARGDGRGLAIRKPLWVGFAVKAGKASTRWGMSILVLCLR